MSIATPELEQEDVLAETQRVRGVAVPTIDGHAASRLEVRFSGTALLRPGIEADVELLRASRLGSPVVLLVRGWVGGKGFTLKRAKDGEQLTYAATIKIDSVEDAELLV